MSWLDAFLEAYNQIRQADAALPQRQILNFVSGAVVVDNPATGATDVTITAVAGGLFQQQTVSGAGSITALVGAMVYVDASGGSCTVTPPAVVANAMWGLCDAHHGSPPAPTFGAGQGANVPANVVYLEDPNAATGAMASGTLQCRTPGGALVWQGDPTGTFWKLVGG